MILSPEIKQVRENVRQAKSVEEYQGLILVSHFSRSS